MRLVRRIEASIVGADEAVSGPFGVRRLLYADYTASGRSLLFIEEYIASQVLPVYANTHSTASATGKQTSAFRLEARAIVKRCVKGGPDDVVLFGGAGTTNGVVRMVHYLGLGKPVVTNSDRETFNPSRYTNASFATAQPRTSSASSSQLAPTAGAAGGAAAAAAAAAAVAAAAAEAEVERVPTAVVFVGPHEHHSNILPWRESVAHVVSIGEDEFGRYTSSCSAACEFLKYHVVPLMPTAAAPAPCATACDARFLVSCPKSLLLTLQ